MHAILTNCMQCTQIAHNSHKLHAIHTNCTQNENHTKAFSIDVKTVLSFHPSLEYCGGAKDDLPILYTVFRGIFVKIISCNLETPCNLSSDIRCKSGGKKSAEGISVELLGVFDEIWGSPRDGRSWVFDSTQTMLVFPDSNF